MTGYSINNRGRYKCDFCDHPTYKTMSGILLHIQAIHELELAIATAEELRAEVDRIKAEPPQVIEKERIVYRDPPPKKDSDYWYPRNAVGVYCPTCKVVNRGAGIPVGQTIENTPHHPCNNRGLMLVLEIH